MLTALAFCGNCLWSPLDFWIVCLRCFLYSSISDFANENPLTVTQWVAIILRRTSAFSCSQFTDAIDHEKKTFSSQWIRSMAECRCISRAFRYRRTASSISPKTLYTMSSTWINFPLSIVLVYSAEWCSLLSVPSAISCKQFLSSSFWFNLVDRSTFFRSAQIVYRAT